MLSTTPQPAHRWISAGALAFSSPRPPNSKDEPATCSSSLIQSTPFLISPLLLPGCNGSRVRKRCDLTASTTITTTATGLMRSRQGGLSCLRGGSDSGSVSGSVEEDSPKTTTAATGSKNDNDRQGQQQQQQQQQQEQEQAQTAGIAGTEGGGGRVFSGIALVTERSTATGGSTDRRCYSVLPDGTLEIGRAHKGSPVSMPSPSPTAPSPTLRDNATGVPADATATTPTPAEPRKMLQGLRRRTADLRAGIGEAAKGVAGEAKAAAVGVGEYAVRAGVAVRGGLANTFLPAGYPASVRPEYVKYRCWDVIQDLSSHLRGVLATQAVLEGMGVGRAGSTPLAATLQWMARDGASMVGGLLFTAAASANFGVNIKTWRLFADASNDIGLALEMLAPLPAFLAGGRFLRLICVASVFKAACGVPAGPRERR
ncbi:unnamed protein product [Pylaiella littoralis]